ncbi:MAG: IPT/TIG domain-containing protein [Actinomycetota bacterium]|nr:IPT/TIG domain-containing protein [Actinomycetota bacterium]MDD5665933.1 IPT/TIG domain-containing protein [Actinomycetota bacterium]
MNRRRIHTTALLSVLSFALMLSLFGCGKAATRPEIKSLEPQSGPPGSEVVIEGASFGSTQGTGVVFFSGREVTVVAWADTVITVKIPTDMPQAAYGVTVETEQGISNEVEFKVAEGAAGAPKITSLNPEGGASGDSVVIGGSGFGKTQDGGKVLFGTQAAQVEAWSDTSITIKVPANLKANTYGVTVENAAGKSNEAIFKIGSEEDKLDAQKQAVISYLQSKGESTAGSEQWKIALVKRSAQDPSWEVVKITLPDDKTFEAVLVFNNMLGDWECLATGEPPWSGIEFKGQPVPSDLQKV